MAAGIVALGVLAAANVYGMFTPAELPIGEEPTCGTDDVMVLMAQAVPTRRARPVRRRPARRLEVGGVRVRRGDARFWLDSDQAGGHAVEVRLRPPGAVPSDGATEVPSDEPAWRRFEQPEQLPPELAPCARTWPTAPA